MTTQTPWLGLAIIVRDAEKTIKTLLNSISGVFDELIVLDTGSVDNTKWIILDHFGTTIWGESRFAQPGANGVSRLVLGDFTWVNDFSAARQAAFELGTAKWRCYLDADDKAEFSELRRMLENTEKNSPISNCVSLKYDYVKDEVAQDTIRLVRWADGWKWTGKVHEHLTAIGHPRVISKYEDVWVRHVPVDPEHGTHSFDRNLKIQEQAYLDAKTPEERSLWAYYLGTYADQLQKHELARKFYQEVAAGLGRNNITSEGLTRWSRMEMRLGNHDAAIDAASQAIGKAPELKTGVATLAVAHLLADAPYRAAGLFDQLYTLRAPPLDTQHDAVWLDGVVNARAAQAYYRIGRVGDAERALERIPEALMKHPEVNAVARPLAISLQKSEGFSRLKALWEYLIWDTEPLKARQLLEQFCPAAISDSPQVQELLRSMEPKLKHMDSWADYQRAYAGIPDEPYHVPQEHRAWTLTQARARLMRQWAESLPKDGEPVDVLVIGVQDGIIEGSMMDACPRIHLTACDVAPQASRGIGELAARFPGRVKTHQLKRNHYDWFPEGAFFDGIILFEVIEHVPDDAEAVSRIWQHLKPDGQFFLSTPMASSWVEPYLSDMKSDRPWWHVRAHNPSSLWKLFQDSGFTGSLVGIKEEGLFLAKMTPAPPTIPLEVAIWVYPLGSNGFDPFSVRQGHVGGSEEACIHLSAALVRKGCKVTVYGDLPDRGDKVFVHEGVQWRPHSEFDVQSLEGALLVWRAPNVAAMFKQQNPRLKVCNWIHDALYIEKPETYRGADATVVLSRFHAEAIERHDGFAGPFAMASNGIVPAEFPEPDESKRDPHAAIYASAPNRGLAFLLEAWPDIRVAVPDATLKIYYSWKFTEESLVKRPNPEMSALLAHLREKFEELKDHGVTYVGGVDHKTLNEAYRTSGVWAYPVGASGGGLHGSEGAFEEIHCISALRAQASGCWPVVIANGALPETCPNGTHVPMGSSPFAYADEVAAAMTTPPDAGVRSVMRTWALAQSWDKAADQFLNIFAQKNNRVTIYAGGFGRQFSAAGSFDGLPLGGSETAVIEMARALVAAGKEVFVYSPRGERLKKLVPVKRTDTIDVEFIDDGATWLDSSTFNPAGPHGTLLAWRCPALVPTLKGNGYPVVLWLMDPHYRAKPHDYEAADAVVYLTETHKEIIRREDGFGNGIGGAVVPICLPELPAIGAVERDPKAVMWASSPDRGLLEFLRDTWPAVVREVPDAKLHIFYGLEPLERAGKTGLADAIRISMTCFSNSVVYHGGVPDAELYEWYQKCSVYAHQCRDFEETMSLSLVKAMALGCYPVVNNTGCLPEVVAACGGLSVPDEQYVHELVQTLKHSVPDMVREEMTETAREKFSAKAMVEGMLAVINRVNR